MRYHWLLTKTKLLIKKLCWDREGERERERYSKIRYFCLFFIGASSTKSFEKFGIFRYRQPKSVLIKGKKTTGGLMYERSQTYMHVDIFFDLQDTQTPVQHQTSRYNQILRIILQLRASKPSHNNGVACNPRRSQDTKNVLNKFSAPP